MPQLKRNILQSEYGDIASEMLRLGFNYPEAIIRDRQMIYNARYPENALFLRYINAELPLYPIEFLFVATKPEGVAQWKLKEIDVSVAFRTARRDSGAMNIRESYAVSAGPLPSRQRMIEESFYNTRIEMANESLFLDRGLSNKIRDLGFNTENNSILFMGGRRSTRIYRCDERVSLPEGTGQEYLCYYISTLENPNRKTLISSIEVALKENEDIVLKNLPSSFVAKTYQFTKDRVFQKEQMKNEVLEAVGRKIQEIAQGHGVASEPSNDLPGRLDNGQATKPRIR